MNEQLKIIISAEIDKLKKGIQDAKSEIDGLDDKTGTSSTSIKDKFSKIGAGAKTAMGVVSKAIAGGVTAMIGLVAATEQYSINQAKLTSAFTTAGASAETATATYNGLYRVLGDGDVATEAANHLAKLTTNQKELEQWTTICQGVYATFGDSLPIEGLTEAANETAKTGVVTGQLADALNWAGISEDEFNAKLAACNSEAEREKLIRTTLNGVYDEAAARYEKNAADIIAQNEAQAKLQASLALVGEALRPVVTAFTNFGADVLAVVAPLLQNLADVILPVMQSALATVKEKIDEVKAGFEAATEWVNNHQGAVTAVAIAVGILTAAVVAYNVAQAIRNAGGIVELAQLAATSIAYYALSAAQAVATVATTAFGAAVTFATSPITLITIGIGLLIAAIVLCVKHWDEISAFIKKTASNIANWIKEMVDKVVKFFEDLKTKISNKVEEIKTKLQEKFEAIKGAIKTKLDAIKQVVTTIFEAIKNVIQTKINTAKTIISNVIGLIKGIFTGDFGAVKQAVANIMSAVVNSFKNKMNTAKSAVKNAINAIKGFFNFKWSLPKLKMPTIKITGKFSLNPPSAPKFSINWNKLGGIFDKPTLFNYGGSLQGIGEDGAEAVVPLEKNTKWLDKLAERITAKQGNTPIVLQVDGKTFAQVSIDSINALTRQRGSLGLNLV